MSRSTTRRPPAPNGVEAIVDASRSLDDFMAEQRAAAAQTFAAGALVRLRDDVGTRAEQATTYRVVRLPDPRAKRKADRAYGLDPVGGGRPTAAGPELLRPATPREVDAANAARDVDTFVVGEVAVPRDDRLNGADPFTKLVVIGVTARGYNVAKLGGDAGRSWTGVPAALLRKVQP